MIASKKRCSSAAHRRGRALEYLAASPTARASSRPTSWPKADIDPGDAREGSKKLAVARDLVFPVLFDPTGGDTQRGHGRPGRPSRRSREVKLVSGVSEIRTFVARPARGDARPSPRPTAATFTPSRRSIAKTAQAQFTTMLNVYERNLVSDESMTVSAGFKEATSGERTLTGEEISRMPRRKTATAPRSRIKSYLETLNVLVTFAREHRVADLRGHSAPGLPA